MLRNKSINISDGVEQYARNIDSKMTMKRKIECILDFFVDTATADETSEVTRLIGETYKEDSLRLVSNFQAGKK